MLPKVKTLNCQQLSFCSLNSRVCHGVSKFWAWQSIRTCHLNQAIMDTENVRMNRKKSGKTSKHHKLGFVGKTLEPAAASFKTITPIKVIKPIIFRCWGVRRIVGWPLLLPVVSFFLASVGPVSGPVTPPGPSGWRCSVQFCELGSNMFSWSRVCNVLCSRLKPVVHPMHQWQSWCSFCCSNVAVCLAFLTAVSVTLFPLFGQIDSQKSVSVIPQNQYHKPRWNPGLLNHCLLGRS
jgi:hypothetical protein